jgi:ABC-2 type transport system ATP-binding protein
VKEATVVGLLGPNGAGKTTAIRILTTLLVPDSGRAAVAGHDVVREAQLVRSVIGLTGQYAAVDEDLTGRENLVLVGRLSRMPTGAASDRAGELLDGFELADAADRTLRTYSGGMRRRLDLAASLMVAPPVLFLDEPTTGLDPRSRLQLWEVINGLRAEGTTIVLTTQYLEEADQLADRISVLDLGRIIAEGTADELKRQVGGDVVDLQLADRSHTALAATALARAFGVEHGEITVDDELGEVRVPVASGANALIDAVRALDAEHVPVADLGLRRPSLDDVFLSLTGHHVEESR